MQVRPARDRRPLLIAAVFALLFVSGLGAVPAVRAELCPSILIASSNEKYGLMTSLAKEYSISYASHWSGCGPAVEVERIPSGEAEKRLADGWTGEGQPDVWSPAANTWVRLLQHDLHKRNRHDLVPVLQYPSIARSPLVVAMPESIAMANGWRSKQPSWKELLSYAEESRGAFRLGKTDPRKSTSGIHSLIAAYYAATEEPEPSDDDLMAPATKDFVDRLERSVTQYGPTVGSFLDNLAIADPELYISALPIEEQEVVHYNRGGHSEANPPLAPIVVLAPVYPKGGTLFADHPFVVLQWPWVSQAKQKTAREFLNWLQRPAQQKQFSDAGFRDYLGYADDALAKELGITKEPPYELRPPSGDVIATMQESWMDIRKRARILVVLALADTSQRNYVRAAVRGLSPRHEVAIWNVSMARRETLDVNWERLRAVQAIESAPIGSGPVPLYETIELGYQFLKAKADSGRISALVVIAANSDDGLGPTLAALQREVRSQPTGTPIRIYTVALKGSEKDALLVIEKAAGGVASSSGDPADAIETALGYV